MKQFNRRIDMLKVTEQFESECGIVSYLVAIGLPWNCESTHERSASRRPNFGRSAREIGTWN